MHIITLTTRSGRVIMSSSCGSKEFQMDHNQDCPGPPPPPPLSPPKMLTNYISSKKFETSFSMKVDEMIEDACTRFMTLFRHYHDASVCLLSLYKDCDAVIQSGPTCGLVALIMCLKLVDSKINIDLPTMLSKAQSHGFTKLGEMFSVQSMADLIQKEFSLKAEIKNDLNRSMLDVIKHLCQGLPVLVPYDADSNYEPCLKKGARAHWTTICGFCIVRPIFDKNKIKQQEQVHFEKIIDLNSDVTLCHISTGNQSWQKIFDYCKRQLSIDRLFVYARQGKSRHIQIWNYRKLCLSNQNLTKVSSKILKDPERVEMIYPKDGRLDESLSNQFLLIYRTSK